MRETGGAQTIQQVEQVPGKKLGKLPAKSGLRALHLARFATPAKTLPTATKFWPNRRAFPKRSFGNRSYGDCTRASQAIAAMRMERLEVHRTPVITDEEVIRVYKEMTTRRYGADWINDAANADTGGYEEDALADWRNPATTFKDAKGRPLVIDAFLKINHADPYELKNALFTAGAHGIKVCWNLPNAFQQLLPPEAWDIPQGQALTGDWMPGSWGGHSMFARDFDEDGVWIPHQWDEDDQLVTWAAVAAYMDEAHLVIDSMDTWRKMPGIKKVIDLDGIRRAVNHVSAIKVA